MTIHLSNISRLQNTVEIYASFENFYQQLFLEAATYLYSLCCYQKNRNGLDIHNRKNRQCWYRYDYIHHCLSDIH